MAQLSGTHRPIRPRRRGARAAAIALLALILGACVPPGGGPPPNPQVGLAITNLDEGQTLSGTVAVSAGGIGGRATDLTVALGALSVDADANGIAILDTRAVGDGAATLEVRATVAGVDVNASVDVTIDNSLAASGTVGSDGGALGAPSGSIAVLPPGALAGEVDLTVIDTTQAEILADFGVDYEALGVTFLGALTLDAGSANGTATRAPIQVDLAGQTQFVQPGQDVIMFAVAPDADGDGVGELMFAANAIATEGGSVVTTPEARAAIYGFGGQGALRRQQAGAARPGSIVTLQGRGFLPGGFLSNVATFAGGESLLFVPTLSDPSDFSSTMEVELAVPALAPGEHTLRFTNLTTGFESDPVALDIGAATGGTQATWDAFVAQLGAAVDGVTAGRGDLTALGGARVAQLGALASDAAAAMADGSGLVSNANLALLEGIGAGSYGAAQQSLVRRHALLLDAVAVSVPDAADAAAELAALLVLATPESGGAPALRTQQTSGSCGRSGGDIVFGTPTGMGSAPSGGCANGSAGGFGGGSPLRGQRLGGAGPVAGAVVRLLMPGTNTKLIPLTAITDEAGYYAFPFVPPGEPFTVQAIAPGSGDTANADGVAGAVSELVTVPLVFAPAGVVPGSPVAAFSASTTGLIASFDASASTDADGTVEEYLWDFGDGGSAVGTASPTIEHRYDAFGSYTVTLTAIDDEAKTGAASQTVTLELGPGTPSAAFTVTPIGSLPGVFRFDASSTSDPDDAIVAYRWDFGDGGFPVTSDQPEVEHIYLRDPSVTVSLMVTDASGQFDDAEQALDTGVTQPYIGDAVEMVSVEADGSHLTDATDTPRPDADGSRIIFRLGLEGELYLKDLDTGALLRVDAAEDGTPSETGRPANHPSIDAAGSFVAFSSSDVALVDVSIAPPFTTNVYIKDTTTGEVVQVPHPTSPGNAIGDTSLSADGTLVAFRFSNIGGTTHFVQDLTDDSFVSIAGEEPLNGDTPQLSSDGATLAYHDPADRSQLVLRDLDGGTVVRVSETSDGTAGDGFSLRPSLSDDGRQVAFESSSSNFTTPAQSVEQIYLKDLDSEAITLISSNALGEPADQRATNPSMSDDGRYLTFQSSARNLVPGVDPNSFDTLIYVKDLQTGWVAAVSVIPIENFDLHADTQAGPTADQQGTIDFLFAAGHTPRISADGRHVIFVSAETNLVLGDNDGKDDVFRVENPLWEPPTP